MIQLKINWNWEIYNIMGNFVLRMAECIRFVIYQFNLHMRMFHGYLTNRRHGIGNPKNSIIEKGVKYLLDVCQLFNRAQNLFW